jgi:hypothetical protein
MKPVALDELTHGNIRPDLVMLTGVSKVADGSDCYGAKGLTLSCECDGAESSRVGLL